MLREQNNFAHSRRDGFTLIESLMSIVIVSGVLVAALTTLGAIGRTRMVQVDRAAAVHLGERMMAEVLQCYFQEPGSSNPAIGTDAGESARDLFDDVDDYDGWATTGTPTLRDGTAMSEFVNWKLAVKVDHAQLADPGSTTAGFTGLKRIQVTVTAPSGAAISYYASRSSNGAYEQTPQAVTTYLTGTGVSAKVGERGKTIYGGAHPLNVTTSQ
jgi:MSHA pilin protein MshD